MKYEVGDTVEVRLSKDAGWHEGVVTSIDDEHYHVKLNESQLLSVLFKQKFRRDAKTDTVAVKKHLETIGIGHIHMKLKNPNFKPK